MHRCFLLFAALIFASAGLPPSSATAQDGAPAASATATEPEPPPTLTRRRPGSKPESEPLPEPPPLPTLPAEFLPVPDRWRIVESLGVNERWYDPYNQNTLKADRPIFGEDWFLNVTAISDSVVEPRRLPTPVGISTTRRSGALDIFGEGEQLLLAESLILSLSLIQGDTVFRPPDYELRFTGVWNWNYLRTRENGLVNVDPGDGRTRLDDHGAVQELFLDKHLRNKSDRYDFDSVRVGIQGFSTDFRGFLFQDNQPGVRLFGNYFNNRVQYNLAWFWRLDKDTNSGLNSVFDLRDDHVFIANVYLQDFPVLGFTLQAIAAHNRNEEGNEKPFFDDNGFLVRPAVRGDGRSHDYQVTYLGLNGDGHFGRLNLMFSGYYAVGRDQHDSLARRKVGIDAFFGAFEASWDFDWLRLKLFGLYSSGDSDPFDDDATGFDPIFENPQFAGADTSFWHRQSIPLIGGGGVVLSNRNALIPSLRPSKEQGQSNFSNPGLGLLGIGADFDILPELRLVVNASWLDFEDTSTLSVLRNQGRIDNHIGEDVSMGIIYRPLFTNNVILRVSGAVLFPGKGLEQLFADFDHELPFYSVLANLILMY